MQTALSWYQAPVISYWYPLKYLAKRFPKHELNPNLSSMSPRPLTTLFSLGAVKKSPNGRNLNRKIALK